MTRPELYHPLIVHFPLALLLTGAALRFAHFFVRKNRWGQASLFSSWIVLLLGVVSAWLAIVAGEVAEDIVRPGLCRPEILEQHKDLAYTTAILFSVALLLDFVKSWPGNSWLVSLFTVVVSITYLVAVLLLIFTGGFGADLVFQQGAAVERVCE